MKEQKGKIDGLEGTISELKVGVEEIRQHNERVYKAQVSKLQQELDTLKASRKQAIEEGDVDEVEQIEKKMAQVQEAAHAAQPAATPNVNQRQLEEDTKAFNSWAEKNTWFNQDPEMTHTAQALAIDYQNKGLPYKAMLRKVSKDMTDIYADFFEANQTMADVKDTRKAPPSPEGSTPRTRATSKFSKSDLTPEQRETMKRFIKMGVMTEAQYIEDLAAIGGIGG
jgi:chromosome segregation ATPase